MKKDNTQLLTVLCEQLQYGLEVKICDVYSHEKDKVYKLDPNTIGINGDKIGIEEVLSHGMLVLPILNEMDLTNPITIGGETFVPLIKLAKMLYDDASWSDEFELTEQGSVYFDMYETIGDFSFENNCFIVELNGSLRTTDQAELFDKLNQWHFNWRNLPESDYIKVSSLPKSPYA